ncbi:serine/threonine-protein kinase [Pyxidicoccus caerfyrddinensis]|uniref:serine/threonine-protein kinase n=1 Tax=Pyxidicoccus caerfyrddinensis TaxID=2709663 RepID=UPI0013DA4AA2|nr:serine/threonine-protein kinase [Pyxidicoccus caerfyrddinensis]
MSEPTAVSDPRIGSVLQERYRIIERLAAGGMGIVYRGERLEVGKAVAIKFLHAWAARDEDFRKRFQVEARAMSRLTHPCCVSVIDFGVDQDSPYMVMDFVTGETLRGLLREGPLPLARALATVRQVLAGLAHAHGQGIIHRDIKPENIIVTHAVGLGEQVRILDFGLAKLRDEVTGITSGMMLGTPAYMAPEQIHGEPVGPPTDLYATGVLLFELLTAKKPFSAPGTAELLRMHREVTPPLLREAAPEAGFSAGLEAVVAKALAKAPGERFQSSAEFLAALETERPAVFLSAPEPASPVASTPARPEEAAQVTESAPAPTRELRVRTPVGAQAPVPAREASVEAVVAAVPDSSRSDSTVRVPAARPPAPEAKVRATPAPSPFASFRSRAVSGGAGGLVLLGAGLVWWAVSSTARPSPSASKGGEAGEGARTGSAPAGAWRAVPEQLPGIDEVHRLIEAQRRDAALAALKKLAAKHPASAYVRYLEGNVDFDNLRWVDGVAAYRAALRNDAAYRNEPTLIQNAIRCLVSDRFHGLCEDFIRKDLGEAAVPYLEDAARSDPMANVRTRASGLLRQR